MEEFLQIPQMLLIGSSGRNSGKTTLAIAMIQEWKNRFPVIGLKVTTVQERDGKCPRGGEGCGVCSNVKGNFELLEETNSTVNKDTSLLLAAGAEKVYWLRTLKIHIYEGIKYFTTKASPNTLIICESNSLRNVVKPGCFIMINNTGNVPIKESAGEVIYKADLIIENDFRNDIHSILAKLKVYRNQSELAIRYSSIK